MSDQFERKKQFEINASWLQKRENRIMTNYASLQQPVTLSLAQELEQTTAQVLQSAVNHHQSGNIQEAQDLYRAILQIQPHHPEANHNLGLMAVQAKQPTAGLPHFESAVHARPEQEQYWLSYIDALIQAGQTETAWQVLELGWQHGLRGDAVENLAGQLGAQPQAMQPLKATQSGKSAKKKASPKALARAPGAKEMNAVIARYDQGRITEVETLARSLSMRFPLHGFGWKVLGAALQAQGRGEEALLCMQKASRLMPGDAEALSNLGSTLQEQGQFTEAEVCLRQVLALKPDYAEAHNNLGNTLACQDRPSEAIKSYRHALAVKADYAVAHSNLLFCLSHELLMEPQQLYAEHVAFGEQFEAPLRAGWQAHHNAKDPARRLQIGFVSGDLYDHALGHFLEPAFKFLAHKPDLILHAYYTHIIDDTVTQRMHGYFAHWHAVAGLSDAELANNIRADGIDILIDLSGHTCHNRLLTFARKPAPVQASWLGYLGTSGLQAMDYYLSDKFWIPPGVLDWQFTEKPAYLPAAVVFQPSVLAPAVNTLPALENGYVTFGSFNRSNKLNESVIVLWSKLLRSVPTAQMVLGGIPPDSQRVLLQYFAHEGIKRSRLVFYPRSNLADYLTLHHRVDFCLDTFPYGGGATTAHAAWMGVPTLSLAGETPPSRFGATEMHHLGLDGFIGTSIEDFVKKGCYWAEHIEELATLRTNMRARFVASPLGQPQLFADNFDAILRTMWQRWCNDLPIQAIANPDLKVIHSGASTGHADDEAGKLLKVNIGVVSATKLSENDFWCNSALGISLKRHLNEDARLSVNIAFENSRGLSEIFNDCIDQAEEDAILVFIHDDVWIDEINFADTVMAGLENFDVIGIAGNRRRVPKQPAWAFIDDQFTWDDKSNLSGRVAHGKDAFGQVSDFGAAPAECELLDGVFLATKKSNLKKNNVRFDVQFDFHFYDMDFCRNARKAGLRLGTWLVDLTHQSGGAFGSPHWKEKYQRYLNKWEMTAPSGDITLSPHKLVEKEEELQQAINDLLQTALKHQTDGQLEQAEHIYLEILKIQPKHADVNHNLGLIEISLKGALAALPRLEIAVMEKPENEQFWVSYIGVFMQSGPAVSVADSLKLGQKYGLSTETAQTLAADFMMKREPKMASCQNLDDAPPLGIYIHQIYYSEQTQNDNDRGFIGLDNLANERPDWSEYWPIRDYLLKNRLNEDGYYGFFSPKFKSKTNLDAAAVHEFVRAYAGEADVFLFSPFFEQGAFHLNIFEQGASAHQGILAAFQDCVAMIAPTVNLATLVMDSRNTVYCNYIVAKPAFWKVWLQSCELIFAIAEENKTVLATSLNASTNHAGGVAPNKVFVIERIASLLLSTQQHWKVKAHNPTLRPYANASLAQYSRDLVLMDALKIASASQGYPEYLPIFLQIRQSILSSIKKTSR